MVFVPVFVFSGWIKKSSTEFQNLKSVHFSSSNGIAVGNDQVAITNDAGTSWHVVPSNSLPAYRNDITLNNDVGLYYAATGSGIYSSPDGVNWTKIPDTGSQTFNSIYFSPSDQQKGWASGGNIIYYTTNAGKNWTQKSSPGDTQINTIYFNGGNNNVWAIGYKVSKTTDGGNSWIPIINTPGSSSAYFIPNTDNGWVVTEQGRIIRIKGGSIDKDITYNTPQLRSVWIDNIGNEGWAVGDGGTVLHTVNGGDTWTHDLFAETIAGSNNLSSVFFENNDVGFIVGAGGTLIKFRNGTPSGKPILISPLNYSSIESIPVTLTWKSVTGIDSYILHYSIFPNDLTFYQITPTNPLDTSLSFSAQKGKTYNWKVEAINPVDKDFDSTSDTWSFNVSYTALEKDSLALLAIDSILKTLQVNWKNEDVLEKWDRVSLSIDKKRVTGLNLSNKNLNISLLNAIGRLDALETLDLSHNQIKSLPDSLFSLISLKHLNLDNNLLSEIPIDIIKLTNLTDLQLQNNILNFDVLESNKDFYNDINKNITLNPQDSVGISTDTTLNYGSDYLINASGGESSFNSYKWYDINGNKIPNETNKILQLKNLTGPAAYTYYCEINNDNFAPKKLTLTRKKVILTVNGPLPTALFRVTDLQFNDVDVTNQKEYLINITNIGIVVGTIDFAQFEGDSSIFNFDRSIFPKIFKPNETFDLKVTFKPVIEKNYSVNLVYTSVSGFENDKNFSIITGVGVKANIQADDYDFGINKINNKSSQITINISNPDYSTGKLIITGYTSSGDKIGVKGSGDIFEIEGLENISTTTPLIIDAGKFYQFKVSFQPDAVKDYNTEIKFASNAIGPDNVTILSGKGSDLSVPSITTSITLNITSNSAISGGYINNEGSSAVTEQGVCWDTTGSPTLSSNSKPDLSGGVGLFSVNITGLSPNTKYFVRAYATNSVGTGYGDEQIFTTDSGASTPFLTTISITKVSTNSAVTGGSISNDGGAAITVRGVCWNTTGFPLITENSKQDVTGGIGDFTIDITGLTSGKQYFVRAYAINSEGIAYGDEKSFTTLSDAISPKVTTADIKNITINSAICGGEVISEGSSSVSSKGVCWSMNPTPTTSNYITNEGSSKGSFISNLTGLNPNTTYYVRAYAINSAGTAYGEQNSFTTAKLPNDIVLSIGATKADSKIFNSGDIINIGEEFKLILGLNDASILKIPDGINDLYVQLTFNPTVFYVLDKTLNLQISKDGNTYSGVLKFKLERTNGWKKDIQTSIALGDNVTNILTFDKDSEISNIINFDKQSIAVNLQTCKEGGSRLIKNNSQQNKIKIEPNPGSDDVKITYTLSEECIPVIKCLDMLGNEVFRFNSDIKQAGEQSTDLDISNLQNGTYYILVEGNGYVLSSPLNVSK
jgi:photosystem II stability/assembly factor-like uncharacterized protein